MASAGVDLDALDSKPLIAIANSWNEICPGHEPLRKLAEEVKKGVLEAGGEPIEFNTIAMCDGIAQGHPGMRYCLPHREIITDSVEAMILGEGVFDGVVYMGSCDKIVPAMLNAAAWISAVGDDELGRYVLESINKEGVDITLVNIDPNHRTGLMIKEFIGDATTVYYYRENSAASHLSPEVITFDKINEVRK